MLNNKNDKNIDSLINSGNICPYCFKKTSFVDSSIVYDQSYGMIYYCSDCKAWVGVHQDTTNALGRLANEALRNLRAEAHYYFDQISKSSLINKIKKEYLPNISNRNKAYLWLSQQLGIDVSECHIAVFNDEVCEKVIEICKTELNKQDKILIFNTKEIITFNTKNISNIDELNLTNMNQSIQVLETFDIEVNDKHYECKMIESGNENLYLVNFNKTYLCLTPAMSASGEPFWAMVPEDYKLKHLAQQIGEQIEKHYL